MTLRVSAVMAAACEAGAALLHDGDAGFRPLTTAIALLEVLRIALLFPCSGPLDF